MSWPATVSPVVGAMTRSASEGVVKQVPMEALKIPVDVQGEGEWATTQATDSTVVIGTRAVASDETGMMPNVIGMGLRDAMYILENHGLRVRLSGSGMVKRQSPAPGTRSMKGSTVTLELAT